MGMISMILVTAIRLHPIMYIGMMNPMTTIQIQVVLVMALVAVVDCSLEILGSLVQAIRMQRIYTQNGIVQIWLVVSCSCRNPPIPIR